MFERMVQLLEEMRVAFKRAKIPEGFLDIKNGSEEELKAAYEWTLALYEGAYKEWANIWRLSTLEEWDRYEKWDPDFKNHYDYILLQKAHNSLRKVIINKKRPELLKRKKMRKPAHGE